MTADLLAHWPMWASLAAVGVTIIFYMLDRWSMELVSICVIAALLLLFSLPGATAFDEGSEVEIGQLQKADRLLKLGRHHQRCALGNTGCQLKGHAWSSWDEDQKPAILAPDNTGKLTLATTPGRRRHPSNDILISNDKTRRRGTGFRLGCQFSVSRGAG